MTNKLASGIIALVILLLSPAGLAGQRGGETPQATAERYVNALAAGDLAELSACLANDERSLLFAFNLFGALSASTVLDTLEISAIQSPDFHVDLLPQDTIRQQEFVALVKRNQLKVGGPASSVSDDDVLAHLSSIAGPDPDHSIAELDRYNRRYLGNENPSDVLLKTFPEPVFSGYQISGNVATAQMGHTTVTFVKDKERWLMSEFFVIGVEVEQ